MTDMDTAPKHDPIDRIDPTVPIDWTAQLTEQLEWHWSGQLRPRLDGLTDDEYFWEPVDGCWNLRPRGASRPPAETSAITAGAGALVADFAEPAPDPAPVTTIAWRIGHLLVGVLGMRNASHFGGAPIDYTTVDWPTTASAALERLDDASDHWIRSIRALGQADLARPVGEAEGPFADLPMAALILHIHREVIHHGAEICLLRDLYRAQH